MGMVALVLGLVLTDASLVFGLVILGLGLTAMAGGVVLAIRERRRL